MDADYRLSWTFLIEHLQLEKKNAYRRQLKTYFFLLKKYNTFRILKLAGFLKLFLSLLLYVLLIELCV